MSGLVDPGEVRLFDGQHLPSLVQVATRHGVKVEMLPTGHVFSGTLDDKCDQEA